MKKLSFILPVYNVEPYLEKCIRSIRDTQMPAQDFEIIVVNDGSPDQSRELVLTLQKELANLILIDQENMGVSAARNKGLEHAQGEYVVFIDPDDYVEPNLMLELYARAKKDHLDLLFTGRAYIDVNGKSDVILGYSHLDRHVFTGIEAFRIKDSEVKTYNSSVGYFYKRAFLQENNIIYPVGVLHIEDGVFLRKVFALAKRVGFENKNFYQIYLRAGSATRSKTVYSKKAFMGYLIAADDLKRFKSAVHLSGDERKLINGMITKFSLLPVMKAVSLNSPTMFRSNLNLMRAHGYSKMDLVDLPDTRIKKFAKYYNISPIYFALYYYMTLVRKKITPN